MKNAKNILLTVCLVALLSTACEKKEILQGKREAISGITEVNEFEKSTINSNLKINLTSPTSISSHTDIAGNKQHNSINYKLNQSPKILWKTSIGNGPINSDMIAFDGNIYAVNSNGILVCISQNDGKKLWEKQIAKQPDDGAFSGGLTSNGSVIYASTNLGDVVAIDTKSQKELWKKSLKYPLRGAPLYVDGKIIVNSIENQTFALNASNGNVIWMKTTSREDTIMSESGTPAFFGKDVICAYSSGDLKSMELKTGSENWSDVLFSSNVSESGVVISHIAASPVVYDGNVLAATSESKMVLLDGTSGIRIWEKDLGTINTPVINNGWIFVLSNDETVVCLSAKDGSTKWTSEIKDLYKSKYSEDLKWTGPLLINGDVVVFSDNADTLKLDASTGKLKTHDIIENVNAVRPPIIIDGKMFVINSRANIYAVK